jgi:hypothetical protein
MLLIVDAGRADRDEFAAQLGRIEAALIAGPDAATAARLDRIDALLRRLGKPPEPVVASATRDLIVAAIAVATMVLVAVLLGAAAAPPTMLFAAFALGVGVALGYVSLAPMIGPRR